MLNEERQVSKRQHKDDTMLKFPDKDFTPAIIKRPNGAITNMLETNENVDSLSKEKI